MHHKTCWYTLSIFLRLSLIFPLIPTAGAIGNDTVLTPEKLASQDTLLLPIEDHETLIPESAPASSPEPTPALTPELCPALTHEPIPTNAPDEQRPTSAEQKQCTNGTIRAIIAGYCLGCIMGAAQFKTRRFFPYNWIVGFFIRILLVEAIATPCTAPHKELIHESAWAADWLVYGYLRLHSLYLI